MGINPWDKRIHRGLAILLLVAALLCAGAIGQSPLAQFDVTRELPCCDMTNTAGVVWAGNDTLMTLQRLASYCAPVLWFSPDEPLLKRDRKIGEIDIPMAMPYEEPGDGPVVYYRFRSIIKSEDSQVLTPDAASRAGALIDLSRVSAIDLDFFFYYPSEEGFGGHVHDVETVEMKLAVARQPDCEECRYGLSVLNINAKAHGVLWYDNTLEVDVETRFPMHILVEEGKHASCTDKNADGFYTPAYDVNKRVNDAWGIRDVMRTGALFTGGFQSWLAKVRWPQDRVFPPLPEDSPLSIHLTKEGVYPTGQRVYTLRPWPRLEAALAHDDPAIVRFADKGFDDWPEETVETGLEDLISWFDEESFVKSISMAARFDNEIGISVIFPLLIFKNVNDPVAGGWLMSRIYLKDKKLRDFGYTVLYTSSASRWIDPYFAAGIELDDDGQQVDNHFVTETGLKFRFAIGATPLKFLTPLTDFWGFRAGVRYFGFKHFTDLGYVVEIGAGSF